MCARSAAEQPSLPVFGVQQPRDYPKAWGNCVLLLMLAGIADVFCTQNPPAKDPPFGDQPDDLAARVGFLVHHFA
jgi:hypothetical protein